MMGQSGENSVAQEDNPAPSVTVALGVALRGARERLGLSVADVANQTKFAPRQIEALEAEDFRHLPEMPFVRGFVRSYAKILQLDALPLLAALPQSDAPPKPLESNSVEAPFPTAHSAQRQNLVWLGIALLLSVLVVAFAVWHFTSPPAKSSAAQAGAADTRQPANAPTFAAPVAGAGMEPTRAAQPAEQTTPSPAQAVKAAVPRAEPEMTGTEAAQTGVQSSHPPRLLPQNAVLRLAFDEESWVEVKDGEGQVLSSQINPRGSELLLDGQKPLSLVIGRAMSVRLYYRGKPVDLTPHIKRSTDVAYLTLE